MKPTTLKEKFTDIIDDRDNGEITDDSAVELCEKVTLEFAKGFGEWCSGNFWSYSFGTEKWLNQLTFKYTTTDQLISEYQEHISHTKSEIK